MTEPTEAEIEAAAKIIDPQAWSEEAVRMWRHGEVSRRQIAAIGTALAVIEAVDEVRKSALMPIYSATEDQD